MIYIIHEGLHSNTWELHDRYGPEALMEVNHGICFNDQGWYYTFLQLSTQALCYTWWVALQSLELHNRFGPEALMEVNCKMCFNGQD